MNNSQLIRFLITFENKQWEELILYLKSPYCVALKKNTLDRRIALVKYLQKHLTTGNIDNPRLYKQVVWKKIFSGIAYNDGRMRKEMNWLKQTAEQYIIGEELQHSCIQKSIALLRYYAKHSSLYTDFINYFNLLEQELHQSPYKDSDWLKQYIELLDLKQERSFYQMSVEEHTQYLKLQNQYQDLYFCLQKVEQAYTFNNHHLDPASISFLELAIQYLSTIKDSPLLSYIQILLAALPLSNINNDEIHLINYTELLYQYFEQLRPKNQKQFYSYAVTYALRRLNKLAAQGEDIKHPKLLYDVYQKIGIEKGAMYIDGKITPSNLRNMCVHIITMKADKKQVTKEWRIATARQLIEMHRDKIYGEHAIGTYQFQLGYLAFCEKDYKSCINHLKDIELPPSHHYLISRRRMLVMSLVELEEIDDLDRAIKNFEQVLRRAKIERVTITKLLQERNLNFINMVKKIIHTSTYKNPERVEKLQKQIEDTANIAQRSWLVRQLRGKLG